MDLKIGASYSVQHPLSFSRNGTKRHLPQFKVLKEFWFNLSLLSHIFWRSHFELSACHMDDFGIRLSGKSFVNFQVIYTRICGPCSSYEFSLVDFLYDVNLSNLFRRSHFQLSTCHTEDFWIILLGNLSFEEVLSSYLRKDL